jgi:16S rRNA processing protein RimM
MWNVPGTEPDQFLAVARIARPQGRRGEVVAEILTDFPERFEELGQAFLEAAGGVPSAVVIEKTWPHKGRIVFKFSGVDSIDQADRLRGLHVFIRSVDRVALPEHHYYVWELEGCHVVRELADGPQEVGVVTGIERTGGVDLLRVARTQAGAHELLIPLTRDICTRIDTGAKTILIDPPKDLLELNEKE